MALGAVTAISPLAATPGASVASAGHRSASGHESTLRFRGTRFGTSGGPLIDHGGKILPTSHTYAIWWGSSSAWSSDVQPGIASLFEGFDKSAYLGIAQRYMRGASIASVYEGSKVDPSAPPKKVSARTLASEVAKEYGTSLDPDGIYFVYTSNFPKGGNFCAWHSLATVNGQSISVAYMPNTTNVAGCDPGNLYNVSGSEGLRSLANVTAHEFMESVTDTLPANGTYAWIDSSGSEIGDKCAWQFTGAVTLRNKTTWQLQEEWSNAADGCVQG
jgi:hypothetical protein